MTRCLFFDCLWFMILPMIGLQWLVFGTVNIPVLIVQILVVLIVITLVNGTKEVYPN